MKTLLFALGMTLAVVGNAEAISRYTSTSLTCDEIHQTIRRDGAALMRYTSKRNPGLQLYGRYVDSRLYCDSNERAETKFIPSADNPSCPVRECIIYDPSDNIILPMR